NRVHCTACYNIDQKQVPWLALRRPIVQSARKPVEADGRDSRREFRQQFAKQLIYRFLILFDTIQAGCPLTLVGVRHAQNQHTPVSVCKCAYGFEGLADHLPADSLELKPLTLCALNECCD
ncbi:MAG TPA: hypothetical protein VFH35_09040, partial [Ramlibacter sp.]|nr:hypothetical protein [Ramlibacter sp.]